MAGYKTNRVEIKEQDYLSEEQKRRAREEERKAAERSAALEKGIEELDVKEFFNERTDPVKKVPEYEPKLFGEEDREGENGYPGFGKSFLEILKEEKAAEQARSNKEKDLPGYRPEEREESKYLLSPTVRASIQRSENMYNAYKSGEEWLMSGEGGDDLVKGFINNFRSAIGTGVEDFAFWLTENAPWYKPAQNVVEKNMAGEVEDQAQRNFGNVKANGVNGKVVDFLDNTSKNLGYSLLGFKAGDYAQGVGEGFDTYRNLREQGYSKEEAAKRSLVNAGVSLAGDKALDKGGKLLGNKVSETLSYHANGKALPAKGWSDRRNQLDKIERRDIIETQAGFACFPDELQNEYAKKIKPEKYIDNGVEKIYFDVAMHGTPQAVGFWSEETNMSPRFLAEVITHNPKYEKGQKVRLLSCNTGEKIGNEYCFAEELANIMEVEVEAPNKKLYMYSNGRMHIGRYNEGEMIIYKPNDRGRVK